jgi:hypothetical protein
MTEHDSLRERGRALEDEYFRKQDLELIEKMRIASAAEDTRRDLGVMSGLNDPKILDELATLGFTPETLALLPMMPVLQVAWAQDGVASGVTEAERRLLISLARTRGVAEHSPADMQLSRWMTESPGATVFAGATRLIRALLDAHQTGPLEIDPADLVRWCERVAEASGSLLNFISVRRVSPEERMILKNIKDALTRR